MTKFVRLRAETYSYLLDDDSEDEKAKGTKKCIIKRKIKFENYKNCLPKGHTTSRGRPGDVSLSSPKGPGTTDDLQGTNTKIDDLMKKIFFRSNSPCVTYLFLFFTG